MIQEVAGLVWEHHSGSGSGEVKSRSEWVWNVESAGRTVCWMWSVSERKALGRPMCASVW